MSEKDAKKAGSRDISDLKARLGLKKGPEGARQTSAIPAQGGVPPPSAAKIGGFVPPPPGVAPPPGSQQPPPPDASMDPFGAMNHMARQGAVQAAPQIVIVDDGKPVEQVSSTARMMGIVKVAVIVIAPLVVGYIFGGINTKNTTYNKMISDSKSLFADFQTVGKGLQSVQDALDMAKDRAKGKAVAWDDMKLVDDLAALKLQSIDPSLLFHSNLYNLDPAEVTAIFQYYSDLNMLNEKIANHIALTKATKKKAYRYGVKLDEKGEPRNIQFGAILHLPSGDASKDKLKVPYFEIVQLGYPKCSAEQKGDPPPECSDIPYAYKVNTALKQPAWSKDAQVAKSGPLADNTIILFGQDFNVDSNELANALLFEGGEHFVDAQAGSLRIGEITDMVKDLSERRAKLQTMLTTESQRQKRFSL